MATRVSIGRIADSVKPLTNHTKLSTVLRTRYGNESADRTSMISRIHHRDKTEVATRDDLCSWKTREDP